MNKPMWNLDNSIISNIEAPATQKAPRTILSNESLWNFDKPKIPNTETSTPQKAPEIFLINKVLWRNDTFIKRLPADKQKGIKEKILWIEDINNPNKKSIRENFQNLQELRNTWLDIDNIFLYTEDSKLITKRIKTINIQDSQKIDIENKLNRLWLANSISILNFLENEEDDDLWFLLLDALTFIWETKWNIFEWNIKLSPEWIDALKNINPNINPDDITLNWLCENVFIDNELAGDEPPIKPLIENALNQRFLASLDDNIWSSVDVKASENTINKIISNPDLLKIFLDYYNYKNLGTDKILPIDSSKPISQSTRKKLEKAIKEVLYQNWFVVNLSEDEKNDIDTEVEEDFERKRNNRIRFEAKRYERERSRWKILDSKNNDNNVPWWKIAADLNLWDKLIDKYSSHVDEIDINDSRVFNHARWKFCRENKDFWLWRLPLDFVKSLYKETNNFTNFNGNWEILKKFKEYIPSFENSHLSEEFYVFYNRYLKEAQKDVSSFYLKMSQKKDKTINNIAIGSVLDWIREIFSDIWKDNKNGKINNLQLDTEEKSIELQNNWECLVINWTFDKNPVKIKYNLLTWEVYMNTCITETNPWNMLVFWNNESNLYIWKISNFSSILENYEDNSDSSKIGWKPSKENLEERQRTKRERFYESFKAGIDGIKDTIKDSLSTNQIKNRESTNFLKTVGIVDNNTKWTIQFVWGSDAYKVMQIINNSNKWDIEVLSRCMNDLMIYAWKYWGDNKPNPNTEYDKLHKYMNNKSNWSIDNNCNTLKYFWEKVSSSKNYEWQKWQISEEYKNWIASLIYEKFTEWEEPNWRLDQVKIEDFARDVISETSLTRI